MSKIKLSSLLVLTVGLELGLKYYLVDHAAGRVSINPGTAFGLGNQTTAIGGIGLFIVLAIIQRLRPLHVWLSLICVVALGAIERVRFGGAVDYLRISWLNFNISDLVILWLVFNLIVYWQQKSGTDRP